MAPVLSAVRSFLLAVLLSAVLFPVAAAAHEVCHLVAYSWFGVPASLQVTPWRFRFLDLQVFGLHAAPAAAPPVPVHVAVDLLGPAGAALPLLVLWSAGRSGPLAAPLLANALVLALFAVLETAFAWGELVAHIDMDLLLWPELNYGAALAIVLAVSLRAVGRAT